MKNFPTVEELSAMSLHSLRLLDIRSGEEEALVQTIINSKIGSKPFQPVSQVVHTPDIKTPEEEAKYQALVDERVAKLKEQPVEMASIVAEGNIDDLPSPMPVSAPVEVAPIKAPWCDSCDSKGVAHKKACPKRLTKK